MTDDESAPAPAPALSPHFPSLAALHEQLTQGTTTSTELTRRCLERIAAIDPEVNAVLALDDSALEQAAEADRRYAAGCARGPLDGIPVLVKDSIDTRGLASTAGSRLLAGRPPLRDAPIVARLRDGGAILLGKTNLSEWSNFRSTRSTEGWSAVGGQTHNPHRAGHSPGGSSSGSAAALAAGLAPLALGAETDGSVVGPAGLCGVVGVKAAPDALPTAGIVPVSRDQDSVGVLAARLADAALALARLAGGPPPAPRPPGPLRIGLWRVPWMSAEAQAVLDQAAAALRRARIAVVPVQLDVGLPLLEDGLLAVCAQFRPTLEAYLRTRPGVPQTLAELVEENRADPVELRLFGQDLFEKALADPPGGPQHAAQAGRRARLAARELLDRALRRAGVQALIAPANEAAPQIAYELGEPGSPGSSTPAALAGYPNVCLPAGRVDGLPVGLAVFGPPDLARLLPAAAAIEHACAGLREPAAVG